MLTFTSRTKTLEESIKQSKKWATTYETGTGSYSYQTIHKEYDSVEELLEDYDKKIVECIRHISDLWFSVKKMQNGKYSIRLRQE